MNEEMNEEMIEETFDDYELELIERLLQFKDGNTCYPLDYDERDLAAKVRRILNALSQRGAGI